MYQRTKGDNVLREQRKEQYLTTKAEYAANIRMERISSWKEYYTMTSATNPWNEIYKIAAGRRKQTAQHNYAETRRRRANNKPT